MVRDFVDRVFDGAAGGLLLHLARDGRLSKSEREHITRLMRDADDAGGKNR
jgi:predicted transcriptional regulator